MAKRFLSLCIVLLILWGTITLLGGWLLPAHLLKAPLPQRTEAQRTAIRARLQGPGDQWAFHEVPGGEGAPLDVAWLHRPRSHGVVIFLHGFGDDAFGTATYSLSLPEWDAVLFTFRGRDRHPEWPSTLGAWERADVTSVVAFLEAQGVSRKQVVLVGVSQGAGVALLALADLERRGGPLGGALLESPFRDLQDAARNHLRGTVGAWEVLCRGAEWLALRRAGIQAHFHPDGVSPLQGSRDLRTPIALLAGDADDITPLAGVQEIAQRHPDLTVVKGADHCEAGARLPGGWPAWAHTRLTRWGLQP